MSLDQQALHLVERIYAAAVDPEEWWAVSGSLSEAFGDAAVGIALQLPGFPGSALIYVSEGFLPAYRNSFVVHLARGLPWQEARTHNFLGRFGLANEVFPDAEVAETDFYRHWMQPQGLAPVGPIGHTIALEDGRPIAAVAAFRRQGGRAFRGRDLELGDRLVPHLARAFAIHSRFGGAQRERGALAEAIDLLPTGVVLLDARHQCVITNRTAERIFSQRDGLERTGGIPIATSAQENAALQAMIEDAVRSSGPGHDPRAGVMAVSRPSGGRAFPLMVRPLLETPLESTLRDAVVALFITDIDGGGVPRLDVLQNLYGLTKAEAELAELLCEGHALEAAAEMRGVTVNTARSQLKQVFAKTHTSRQGELVRLVLAGIAPIRSD